MNKKITLCELVCSLPDFCHYRVMIKIKDIVTEKRTGFKGEVVNIRVKGCKTLFVVDFGRATRSFTRNEIATKLDEAVKYLGSLVNDEGKRPLPWGRSQVKL